jgi:DNA-binding YbaB/EbfC family protein
MFEGLKDMGKLLKQAKEMKEKMKKVQEELKKVKVTATTQNERIKVVMTGELQVTEISIDAFFLATDKKEILEKSIAKAFNDASEKAKQVASTKLSAVSGDLNLPGM